MNSEKGMFWIPENPERKVAGILTWSADGISLDLVGSFQDYTSSEKVEKHLLINGSLGTKPVILYDSFENQRSFHLSAQIQDYTKHTVSIVFFGLNVTNSDDLFFHKCVFEPTFYDQWVNQQSGTNIKYDYNKFKVSIDYELPDPIETRLPNGKTCRIAFGANGPQTGFHRKDISLKQTTGFSFESSRKMKLRVIIDAISHYSKLVMLFTQLPAFMENVKIYYRPPRTKDYLKADLFWSSRSHPQPKEPSPNDFLFYYSDIRDEYDDILKKWFADQSAIEVTLNSYFETFFTTSNVNDFALNILKSMESYHRETINSGRCNLVDRYVELFGRVSRAFNPFLKIPSKQKYCNTLKNLRHDLAHNNPLAVAKSSVVQKRYRLAVEAKMILTCNILFDLGISLQKIRNRVSLSHAFSNVKKRTL